MDTKDFPPPFRKRAKRASRKLNRRYRQFPEFGTNKSVTTWFKLTDRQARLMAVAAAQLIKSEEAKLRMEMFLRRNL